MSNSNFPNPFDTGAPTGLTAPSAPFAPLASDPHIPAMPAHMQSPEAMKAQMEAKMRAAFEEARPRTCEKCGGRIYKTSPHRCIPKAAPAPYAEPLPVGQVSVAELKMRLLQMQAQLGGSPQFTDMLATLSQQIAQLEAGAVEGVEVRGGENV